MPVRHEFLDDRLRPYLVGTWVDGVEVTQGIQYSRAAEHLTSAADRRPDNAVPMVADKAAWVRVYVRSRFGEVPGLTATAVVQRRRAFAVWVDVDTLRPQGTGTMTADPDRSYDDERRFVTNSLNFVVPAAMMRGHLRLRIEVRSNGGSDFVGTSTVEIRAGLRQTLHLRGFAIQYDGPDAAGNQINIPAPSLADFQTTLAWTLLTWPVSQTPQISILGPTLWSTPLTGNITVDPDTQQAQCPTSWNDLLGWLAFGKWLDGNRSDVFYYGLLPNGIPVGQAAGCGGGVVAAGFVNQGQSLAHELGHSAGFGHAPCGLVAGDMGDPSYPTYEPYPAASIGEYGIDVNTGQVASPTTARDTMSYCGPRWPSLYHYVGLIEHPRLHPTWIADPGDRPPVWEEIGVYDDLFDRPDPPPWFERELTTVRPPERRRLVAMVGRLERGRPEVDAVVRLDMFESVASRVATGLRLELIDDSGEVLSGAPVMRVLNGPCGHGASGGCGGCGGGCGGCGGCGQTHTMDPHGSGRFEAYVDDDDRAVAFRLLRGEEEVWSRTAQSNPPQVNDLGTDQSGDQLHVHWDVSTDTEEPLVSLRWSGDDGQSWSALGVRLPGRECVVPLSAIAARRALLQLVVSDGFYTTLGEPVPIELPEREPQAAVLFPPHGARLRQGEVTRLWGLGTSDIGEPLTAESLRWFLDGEEVGVGQELWLERNVEPGEHEVLLVAETPAGRGRATSAFTVRPHR